MHNLSCRMCMTYASSGSFEEGSQPYRAVTRTFFSSSPFGLSAHRTSSICLPIMKAGCLLLIQSNES